MEEESELSSNTDGEISRTKATNKYADYIYDSPETDDEYISPAPRLPQRKTSEVQQLTQIEPGRNLHQKKSDEGQQLMQIEPGRNLNQNKSDEMLPPTKCHNCKTISSKHYLPFFSPCLGPCDKSPINTAAK